MHWNKLFNIGKRGDIVALVSGVILTLAFAPYHIFILAIIAPALLLASWLHVNPGRAFRRGYLFGVGFFSTSVYWVYISIHTYGEAPVALSLVITLGFILLLALFPALTGYWLNRFFPNNNDSKRLLAFPAIWVLVEWMRSWAFTGFPWGFVGYSQISSPLKGYAPILSVYGVSLAALISSALLVSLFVERKNWRSFALGLFAIWAIGGALSYIPWTKPQDGPIQVSLVQGNIPQQLKWHADQIQPTLDHYVALTQDHFDSQIIIWPEAAIPIALQDAKEFVNVLDEVAVQHHTTILTGIPVRVDNGNGYYNAVIALGENHGAYLKRQLVPFGEYTPMGRYLHPILAKINIPMADMISGPYRPTMFKVGNTQISTEICFEIAFPELSLERKKDMGIILTVSNDAWFGHSSAQAQHLQTAQMRAIEMRRPVLFVANNGITAIIDPYGHIQSKIPPYQDGVLTDKVQARIGLTPWQRYATDPILFLLIGMLFIGRLRKK